MLALLVAAMDSTAVGTALPAIGGELGNFSLYPWVFAGYLLTATTTVPIWGRLADIFGRKRVLFTGLSIFVGASVLCGAAPNMLALVVFRSVQGIGAGCLLPVTLTVVGDLFPMRQRARVQGLFSGMWAVASIIGPLLGATFVSTIGWRWIFDINVPIGLGCAGLLWTYQDRPHGSRVPIDWTGAALLTTGVALLLLGFGAGSSGDAPSWPAIGTALLILGAFVLVERRQANPTVPLRFLLHPVIGPALLAAILAGTLMFGLTSYVPLYVQGALGGSPYQAGAAIAPLSLGWPAAAVLSGRLLVRAGYQRLVVVGAAIMVVGTVLFASAPRVPAVLWLAIAVFVIGFGMGMLQTPLLIVLQSVVDWRNRGAVTALNQFSRTIGGAIGVALMGVLILAEIHATAVARGLDPASFSNPLQYTLHRSSLSRSSRSLVAVGVHSLNWVFLALAAATLATAIGIALRSPRQRA